ncbi:MAG: hypothetical protein AB7W59_19455 [Acidimicrobiia bacterium]
MFETKAVEVAIDGVRGYLFPTPEERAAAYELLVEFGSRTITAPLAPSEGSIREALSSIYAMFGITREVLRRHGLPASKGAAGNLSLAVVAMRVLNEGFRPVLSRWHVELAAHEQRRTADIDAVEWERSWPAAAACRGDLIALRMRARAYIETLAQIAGVAALGDLAQRQPPSRLWTSEPVEVDPSHQAALQAVEPSKMVGWVALSTLAKTKWAERKAHDPGRYGSSDATKNLRTPLQFEAAPGEDFIFDYVADSGDGFDPTAAVAWLIGRQRLSLPGDPLHELPNPPVFLPRARLLVMGGDQVYPYAADGEYERRLELPYALGWQGPPGDATVVAIPGNHDWYGGIGHFEQTFIERDRFAHWGTGQQRRFWHVQLPQGWWLWGIDTGLDNVLPDAQIAYFQRAAESLKRGDRVIVCTPVPLWQLRQRDPASYRQIREHLEGPVQRNGARIPLWLSGDSHFFAHYQATTAHGGEDHVTSGGGGAFTSATHNLPERIPLERGNPEFSLTTRWPAATDSRALAMQVPRPTDRRFWGAMGVAAVLQAGYLLALRARIGPLDDANVLERWPDALRYVVAAPASWVTLAIALLAGRFAVSANSSEDGLRRGASAWGAVVGAAVTAALLVIAVGARLLDASGWWLAPFALVGGWLAVTAFFSSLAAANRNVKAGDNLALSVSGSTRFKHFVRCRIDTAGDLNAYVVGVDPVGEGWARAIELNGHVPPPDPAGPPRLHYVWGKRFPKFDPPPMRVAISISEAGEEHDEKLIELYRKLGAALLDRGHCLLYGGYPLERTDGDVIVTNFTAELAAIAHARHLDNPNAKHRLIRHAAAYQSQPATPRAPIDVENIVTHRARTPEEPPEHRELLDLRAMRLRQTEDAHVRIVIGGRLRPLSEARRVAPGVLEEAFYSVERRQPVLIAGGYGGVAQLLAKTVAGELEIERRTELAAVYPPVPDLPTPAVMLRSFSGAALLRNHLADGENHQLFTSCDVEETVDLLLRGIDRIGAARAGGG